LYHVPAKLIELADNDLIPPSIRPDFCKPEIRARLRNLEVLAVMPVPKTAMNEYCRSVFR
jgi:hypothetical protein